MFYVYLLASKPRGTLYVGVTSDLLKRVFEHKAKAVAGFTSKYGVERIKEWKRDWKISLIEADNPRWTDRYPGLSP